MLNDSTALDRAFQALSDPVRRGMLARLSRGRASVSELAAPLPISLPAVLQHLKALEASGLVAFAKSGPRPHRVGSSRRRSPPPNPGSSSNARLGSPRSTASKPMSPHSSRRKTSERTSRPEARTDARRAARAGVEGVDGSRAYQAMVGAAPVPDAGMRDRTEARRQILHAHDRTRTDSISAAPPACSTSCRASGSSGRRR